MTNNFYKIGFLVLCWFLSVPCGLQGQSRHSSNFSQLSWANYLELLEAAECNNDLPAPTVLNEPVFTIGASNQICFLLPPRQDVPIPPDKVYQPLVRTFIIAGSDTIIEHTPVDLDRTDTLLVEIGQVPPLQHGATYEYVTDLIVGEVVRENGVIVDVIFHCSPFSNRTHSTQDAQVPAVGQLVIPELANAVVVGWLNASSFEIQAELSDPAGVQQAFLYRRKCDTPDWQTSVADTIFQGAPTDSGFVYAPSERVTFRQNLSDGCYEFRMGGKDAAHTAASCFPYFEVAGNQNMPAPSDPAQMRIRIDTTPPDTVTVNCRQDLNTIVLNWSPASDPPPGIGVMRYDIYRDGTLIASVPATQTQYGDSFSAATPDTFFMYQIQPLDSLGNRQTSGGNATCEFIPLPHVTLVPEPEFTPGDSNTLCWQTSGDIESLTVLLDQEGDFIADDSINVADPETSCASFFNLEDGIRYYYWVRAQDEPGRSVFSDTVWSIQDATPPEIAALELLNKSVLNGRIWTRQPEIELRLTGSDPAPGEIWNFEILENGVTGGLSSYPDSAAHLDTTLAVVLQSAECQGIGLSAVASDGAGNRSAAFSLILSLDATPPDSVTLTCKQELNAILLDWTPASEPESCSGVQGYFVLRDQVRIDTVAAPQTHYEDQFAGQAPNATYRYQIQPFDSLGNVQKQGGRADCVFVGPPQVVVQPEPQFTAGRSNEICWQTFGSLASLQIFRDENSDGVADDSVKFTDPAASCYTFASLMDGKRYGYWLVGEDAQHRFVFSDTVSSIQDDTPPELLDLELVNGDTSNGRFWVFSEALQLHLLARDTAPGELWNYEIGENDQFGQPFTFADSTGQVNETVTYKLQTSDAGPVELRVTAKVRDGAGNVSNTKTVAFIFQHQSAIPKIFAFPNPFNPMQEDLTIRLQDVRESELRIYDFFGNLVRTLTHKSDPFDFSWDGRNGKGEMVASGGYICVGTRTQSRFKIGVMKVQ